MSAILNQEGFCFIYTAQVGVIILSCVGLTLVSISIVINATAHDPKLEFYPTLMRWLIFIAFMLLCIFTYVEGLVSVFMGHNADYNRIHAIIAATSQAVVIVAWVGLIVSSYLVGPYEIRYICINNRCADRLFLQPSGKRYNTRQYEVNYTLLPTNSTFIDNGTKPSSGNSTHGTDRPNNTAAIVEQTTHIIARLKTRCYGGFVNWIVSVVLSFFIFLFFMYTEIIYISYANTIETYFEDDLQYHL